MLNDERKSWFHEIDKCHIAGSYLYKGHRTQIASLQTHHLRSTALVLWSHMLYFFVFI